MKRKKLERLIVEIIEDREAVKADLERFEDAPSEQFVPMTPMTWPILSGSTLAPWCAICQGFHLPGNGACTATYTWSSTSTGIVQ